MTWPIITILFLFNLNFLALANERAEGDCYLNDSYGTSFSLSEDQFIMIFDLNRAIESYLDSSNGAFEKKVEFFQSLIPSIVMAMGRIEVERAKMLEIINKNNVTSADKVFLDELKKKYRTDSVEELKLRVNIVPVDLVLAQAAIESGWGTSRPARECNNYFGIHALGGLSKCGTKSGKIASFSSKKEAIDSYLLNLNRHVKYDSFRRKRSEMLTKGEEFSGRKLALELKSYSVLSGQKYTQKVRKFIKQQKIDTAVAKAIEITEDHEMTAVSDQIGIGE